MAGRKVIDEAHHFSRKRGNGQQRREVWVDAAERVTRYSLAYINHDLYAGDHDRVVGYDNQHGWHHRHWFGTVSAVDFVSFEHTESLFEADWLTARTRT